MLAPAEMLVVFVLGESISLGTSETLRRSKWLRLSRYVKLDLKVPQ